MTDEIKIALRNAKHIVESNGSCSGFSCENCPSCFMDTENKDCSTNGFVSNSLKEYDTMNTFQIYARKVNSAKAFIARHTSLFEED